MMGFAFDWNVDFDKETDEKKATLDSSDSVHVGDIVTIFTRAKKPIFATSSNYDDMAQLRVLGESKGDRTLYLCLVTDGDAEHISPTVIVGKNQAHDYNVEPFYRGCDAIIVSDLHLRGIAKKQRGRFCDKCTEYNEDVHVEDERYLCHVCRENPWR